MRATNRLLLITFLLALAPGCKDKGESETPEPAGEGEATAAADPSAEDEAAETGDGSVAQAGPSTADTVRHPGAAIELEIPSTWNQEREGESLMIMSPDETVLMVFTAVPAPDLNEALSVLDKQLSETITDSEVSGFSETQLHGMPALFADGKGVMDNTPVELGVALVLAPDDRVLIALGLAQPNVTPETGKQLTAILRSLRPAR